MESIMYRTMMLIVSSVVALHAVAAVHADPMETLRQFRAPAVEVRQNVPGFVWIEAESFADYGGWEVDTQFVHKMGSAYLIAKGVLKPLSPAKTDMVVPSSGNWRVWVRTRDWLPEFSPGKFCLEIDGRRSADVGVSGRKGWRWENAGDFSLDGGAKVCVRLVDLSGGFARCDAVLLTRDISYVPPDDDAKLSSERIRLTGADPFVADGGTYDVVVVGAGPAGLASAIAAARCGARTVMVHDRPVLGGNASVEQDTYIGGSGNNYHKGVVDSREGGILEESRLLRRTLPKQVRSAAYRRMVDAEELLTERSNERVISAERSGDRVESVLAVNTLTGQRIRYKGKMFVDGTGDGWIGFFVGAERMYGREAKAEYGEKDAPEKADTLTMSGCLNNYVYRWAGREVPFDVPGWVRVLPDGFDRSDVNGIQSRWWLEHPGTFDDLEDPERARDELVRINLDYWNWLRNHPKFGHQARRHELKEIKLHNGRREGWRLRGDYVLTSTDCREGRRFEDAIACGGWALDLHDPMGVQNPKGDGWWSVDKTLIYDIPYRTIYSRNISNLFMCGRNISVTHAALGSTRIMGTIFALGQAAGTAAAMAVRENLSPREIGRRRIRELRQQLLKDDQFIPYVKNEDPADKARAAKIVASSSVGNFSFGRDDLDFEGVTSHHAWRDSLRKDVAACVPRGDLKVLEGVSCYMRNNSGVEQTLQLEVFESDSVDPKDSSRIRLAVMKGRAAKEKAPVFVKFAGETPVRLSKKHIWLKMSKCNGVEWFHRLRVYPFGGYAAYGKKTGEMELNPDRQFAFYTEPALKGAVDSRPEYVIDGFSRPDIYPSKGVCTHAWRSNPVYELPQWIRLVFHRPQKVGEVRLTFDTGLTFEQPQRPFPKTLVKDYTVFGRVGREWRILDSVKGNVFRLRVHRFEPVEVTAIKVRVDATWGARDARIQEIRVY